MFRAFEEISKYYVGVETLILGCTKQTNLHLFLQPVITSVKTLGIRNIILTEPQGGRSESLSVEVLSQKLSFELSEVIFHNEILPSNALQKAISLTKNGTLLCIGSLYLIGNILSILECDDVKSMSILSC